ncbi:CynX/NimT family MFS transporter [Streptomyces boninensis]|uniref:CynX/NimT family MFS transporter n=1 Tax=Streptomyces boninensis TaxID=2039455 RepID=UPI003B2123A2
MMVDMLREKTTDTSTGAGASSAAALPEPTASPWPRRIMVTALLLAAVNLRPAISSLGAMMEEVRDGVGMNGTVAGLLTSMPAVCFAIFGSLAPRLARRFGPAKVVCGGMVAIAVGLAVRPLLGNTAGFLAASAIALAGIAVSNVLLPAIVKRWFPDRVGPMTGLYSMGLALGTSAAAAATVPIADTFGGSWRVGLGAWALVAAVAVLPWAGVLRGDRKASGGVQQTTQSDAQPIRLTRSPTAWALGVFFGFQATAAYVTLGWLPQIYRDAGLSAGTAGVLLAVVMGLGVPLAFVLPRVAERLSHQGPIAVVMGLCGLVGYGGLWLWPHGGAWVWALLLAVSNCSFPLVLTLIGMRSRTGAGVVKLSAFAQSTGYVISIPGPLVVGGLYSATGGWGAPLALMAALMVIQIAVGVVAGRDRMVEDEV